MTMPFAGTISDPLNGTLLFSFVAALLYAVMVEREPHWRRTVAKTMAVGLLAVLAWRAGGPMLLVAALALSAIGDALLAQEDDRTFLGGLGAFLLAHLAYIALFIPKNDFSLSLMAGPWRGVLVAVLIGFALLFGRRLVSRVPGDMRLPVIAYLVVIVAMVAIALGFQNPRVAFGALLFAASDTILASEKFLLDPSSPNRRVAKYAVWISYYAAQVLIVLGLLT